MGTLRVVEMVRGREGRRKARGWKGEEGGRERGRRWSEGASMGGRSGRKRCG